MVASKVGSLSPRERVQEAVSRAEKAAKAEGGGPFRLKEALMRELTALVEEVAGESKELIQRAHGAVAWAIKSAYDDAVVACLELNVPAKEAADAIRVRRDDAIRGAVVTEPKP